MPHMEVHKLSSRGRQLFETMEFDDDEQLEYEIRKHPFGLFLIYLTGTLAAGAIFLLLVAGPSLLSSDPLGTGSDVANLKLLLAAVGGLLAIITIVLTAIGAFLYQSNVVLITSEKIAQILYPRIFDRKISQLGIGDIQDVTVSQKGLLARLFNYGTLVIETAGEQDNYTFTYTPHPYEAGKAIVGAHEENLKLYGN